MLGPRVDIPAFPARNEWNLLAIMGYGVFFILAILFKVHAEGQGGGIAEECGYSPRINQFLVLVLPGTYPNTLHSIRAQKQDRVVDKLYQ